MRFTTRTTVRVGLAVSVVAGLAASGMAGAVAAPRSSAPYERPYIDLTINDDEMVGRLGGGALATGQMDVSLEAVGADRLVAVVRFAKGYGFHDYREDLRTAFTNLFAPDGDREKGLKALNHAINHTTAYGGISAPEGKFRHGTVLFDKEGRYVFYDDSHNLPRHPLRIDIAGSVGPQKLQQYGGTVKAKDDARWGGDDVLPAKGNIRFKNISSQSPHFLVLQHVKEGTTKKQVLEAFQSESNEQPEWVLPGEAETDTLSYGQQQTFHVNLPAGQYVELCFFPDPQEGMPHAFMGMIRMVHLK